MRPGEGEERPNAMKDLLDEHMGRKEEKQKQDEEEEDDEDDKEGPGTINQASVGKANAKDKDEGREER